MIDVTAGNLAVLGTVISWELPYRDLLFGRPHYMVLSDVSTLSDVKLLSGLTFRYLVEIQVVHIAELL